MLYLGPKSSTTNRIATYDELTGGSSNLTLNRQTANYTLVLGDANNAVEMNVASANNLTVPTNASVAFSIGSQIIVAQYGVGRTTFVPSGGVTINSVGGLLSLSNQFSAATLVKIGTNEWYLFGDLYDPSSMAAGRYVAIGGYV